MTAAALEGLLQPLSSQHRISLYADDVVLFLRPVAAELNMVIRILDLFGEATGLKANVHHPMQSNGDNKTIILGCDCMAYDQTVMLTFRWRRRTSRRVSHSRAAATSNCHGLRSYRSIFLPRYSVTISIN